MIRAVMLAGVVVLGALPAVAQQPLRDTAPVASARVGTASVSGIVTLGDETQTLVRRAVVTMLSSDGVEARSTVSDDDGRFTIGGIPAGRYTLQALKPAHLTMSYGARRPGRLGTTLVVADGQSIRDLRLSLPRGAVLAGRLTLENGESLPNALVMAIPARLATAGGIAPTSSREFRTDDRGEFRIYGLLPDTYLLAVLPVSIGEIHRRSDDDFDEIVRRLQQPTPQVSRTAGASADSLPPAASVGYAPTYFPGTPMVSDATPIAVRAGEVRERLDFTISRLRMATVSGTVLGTSGEPVQIVRVSVEPEGPPLPRNIAPGVNPPDSKGAFSIAGLPPGRYRIRAHAAGTVSRDGQTFAQTEWAVVNAVVTGDDLTGLTLALQAGHVFSGRMSTGSGTAPASWKGAVVTLQPTSGNPGLVLNGLTGNAAYRQAPVGDDGRFTVTGLVPYDYEIRVTLPPALTGSGWKLESIRQRGRDLGDAPLTFAEGSIDGVEIALTTAVTELAGRLTSESGAPATDFFLVAFPDDRALWHAASPRIRVARPGADGAFSIRDLPAGAYRLAALSDVEDDEPKRREFLESIYDTALRVTVEAGKQTLQELRIK